MTEEPLCIVYQAVNKVNGKRYIGVCSSGVAKRRREHFCASRKGSNLPFHRAIKKYGGDNFVFEILEAHSEFSDALEAEVKLISERQPEYNLTKGGQGAVGFKMPKEIVERLAAARRGSVGYWRGKKRPSETVEKIREARLKKPVRYWLGKSRSQETKTKISETKKGKPRGATPPHLLAIFAENMRRAARARRREIISLEDGLRFLGAAEVAAHYGLKPLSVSQACHRGMSLFGHRFRYADEVTQ